MSRRLRGRHVPDDVSAMWRGRVEGKLDSVIVDHERRITQNESDHRQVNDRVTDIAIVQARQENTLNRAAGLPTKIIAGISAGIAFIALLWAVADRLL